MMELTSEEQAMLDGKYGAGTALAMKIQVAVGEAYNAVKMVPVTRTHVALSNQEADLWFVEKLVNGGAVCRVSPTVNPGFNLEYFQKITTVLPEDASIIKRTREAYRKIGATLTYNCTPYLEKNIPRFGEITAYSESSATPFINSVYGARTNREAAQSALCAAVTGVAPLYGYLVTENRKGQILVEVAADLKNDFDYQLLGYAAPQKTGFKIPVFVGMPDNPTPEALMNFGAELNTGGNVALYHMVGVTPEAPTIDAAFQGEKPPETVTINNQDLREMHAALTDEDGKIDFALFGCPHFTISQVAAVAKMVAGQKLAVPLWIMTSSLTTELAKRMGLLEILQAAGGDLVPDTCMDQPCWRFLYGKKGVTDSPKCAYYTRRRKMSFVIRSVEESVAIALRGEC
jgi:predicted aconitase